MESIPNKTLEPARTIIRFSPLVLIKRSYLIPYVSSLVNGIKADFNYQMNKYNFYNTNSREWTILNTNNFGKVIQVEIGALCIGRIKNQHETYIYKKGEEKGYFEFGGSTIVLLFKKNTIKLDEDIYKNSQENIETIVKYGERIGKAKFFTRIINKLIII